MDWKKAKTILISVFIILNIVLAVVLYNNLKVEEVSEQTILNTGDILQQNKVHIECPIPKDTGKDYILQYEEKGLEKTTLVKILLGENYSEEGNNIYKSGSKSLLFSSASGFEFIDKEPGNALNSYSESDMDKYVKDMSEKLGLPFDEFRQDGYYPNVGTGDGARVVYKGKYENYSVFDNYIDVEASKSDICIKYHYNKPISITVKKDIDIVPVYEILITKMTNYPGSTIISVDKGFKGKVDKDTKNLYDSLSWRIITADEKELYFNAKNGKEME